MPNRPIKSLEQAWDLGFCDGLGCADALMAENERLRAERDAGCAFCQFKHEVKTARRKLATWRFIAVALLAAVGTWVAKRLI